MKEAGLKPGKDFLMVSVDYVPAMKRRLPRATSTRRSNSARRSASTSIRWCRRSKNPKEELPKWRRSRRICTLRRRRATDAVWPARSARPSPRSGEGGPTGRMVSGEQVWLDEDPGCCSCNPTRARGRGPYPIRRSAPLPSRAGKGRPGGARSSPGHKLVKWLRPGDSSCPQGRTTGRKP